MGALNMVSRVTTVAFEGIEARAVDVQVQISPGLPAFAIVGLADKAVAESRERVRAALTAVGLALPPKRITVNLAPADLPKEGSHYDLPIALALMAAIGAVPADALDGYVVIGELALDGGYALVGLRRPAPTLFDGIAWSTPAVMAATRDRAAAAGLRWAELAPVADIDEPADLARLPASWRRG